MLMLLLGSSNVQLGPLLAKFSKSTYFEVRRQSSERRRRPQGSSRASQRRPVTFTTRTPPPAAPDVFVQSSAATQRAQKAPVRPSPKTARRARMRDAELEQQQHELGGRWPLPKRRVPVDPRARRELRERAQAASAPSPSCGMCSSRRLVEENGTCTRRGINRKASNGSLN